MNETVSFDGTFRGWQQAARRACQRDARPEDVLWKSARRDQGDLDFGQELELVADAESEVAVPLRVPKQFMDVNRSTKNFALVSTMR